MQGSTLGTFPLVAEQFTGPDLGVEGDIVLTHEIVGGGGRVGPEIPPGVGVAATVRPFDRSRQVAHDGVEPHIEFLPWIILPALHGDGNAPVNVAAHGAGTNVGQQVEGEFENVGPPIVPGLQPCSEFLGKRGQVEKEMLGFYKLWGFPIDFGNRVDKVRRIKLVATVVALVAAGPIGTADGAGTLNIAVGQRAAGGGRNGPHGGFFQHVAVIVQAPE